MENDQCIGRIVHQEKVDLARANDLEPGQVKELCRLFKAFSEPGRLRMMHALLQQEMCVCDLAALLGISESAVSHQLRMLRNLGLVANRREGTVLYYRPVDGRLSGLISFTCSLQENKQG